MTAPRWLPTNISWPSLRLPTFIIGGLIALYLLTRVGPTVDERAVRNAENGYRVAKARVADRLKDVQRDSTQHVEQKAKSDVAVIRYRDVSRVLDTLARAYVPEHPIVIVGPALAPSDTLVTLGLARAIKSAADTAIRQLLTERFVADTRIRDMQSAITLQSLALASADTVIATLQRDNKAKTCRLILWRCPSRAVSAVGGIVVGVAGAVYLGLLHR